MAGQFKVLIAGSGPAGLVAAHALHLAGIDFTVLEARDNIANDVGASLVLAPDSLRIMHQFGLYKRLTEIGAEMKKNTAYSVDGRLLGVNDGLHYIKDNHGSAPVAFHRAELIETLYDGLPDEAKSRIQTGKKILNVETVDGGVSVTCTDGSIYTGSALIGADGVHSKTRRQMRKLALEANPSTEWDPETPYTAHYRCLWSSFPAVGPAGEGTETHDKDRSVMYLAGKTRGWIFLYEKLPEPTKDRVTYTNDDVLEYAARFADFPVTEVHTVKDLFANRLTAGMSNLEEGVVQNWTWNGRIALVGDACHKYTPNRGLGLNNGIQDVVALCNSLVAAVRGTDATTNNTTATSPTSETLAHVFQQYQRSRRDLALADCDQSAQVTRMHADANLLYYILGHYVMLSKVVQYVMLNWLAPRELRKKLVLDYVAADEPFVGAVGWDHPLRR